MCIHHIIFHQSCGHFEKNAPLSTQSHCKTVDIALRYYHDQPAYHPVGPVLTSQFKLSQEHIRCPATCQEMWPPRLDDTTATPQEFEDYQAWCAQVMAEGAEYWTHHRVTKAHATHSELDNSSEINRVKAAKIHREGTIAVKPNRRDEVERFTNADYPTHQLQHILDLEVAQLTPAAQPAWNVIIHKVPYGCGRRPFPQCQIGHFNPIDPTGQGLQGPQCPYLLVCRQPPGYIMPEHRLLGDSRADMRGGALNLGRKGYQGYGQENTRTALLYDAVGGMGMVELSQDFLDRVFLGGRPPWGGTWHNPPA